MHTQVIVLQSYQNESDSPIEAKYVFPLDDLGAVCGFEAFINGKHVIGKVKEKEQVSGLQRQKATDKRQNAKAKGKSKSKATARCITNPTRVPTVC